MQKPLLLLTLFFISIINYAQDTTTVLFKKAEAFEYKQKGQEALNIYKQILSIQPDNIKALVKTTEVTCFLGDSLQTKPEKYKAYETALQFAQKAVAADSNSAIAYYALSLVNNRMIPVETDNKKLAACIKNAKQYADKALLLDPKNAMANFIEGKWHYDMESFSQVKKAALKTFYAKFAEPDLDTAIQYFERSKSTDPYFMFNNFLLAKAYKQNNNLTKSIEMLNRVTKLPIRRSNDVGIKEEAKQLLQDLQ